MKRLLPLLACAGLLLTAASAQTPETVPASAETASARVPGPQPGELAPDFTAFGPDGRPVRLSDFRGKIVLLDIWATWCGPCIASMPHHSRLAETYAKDDLVVLAVCASDSRESYDSWLQRNASKYKFLTAHDPAGRDWKNSVFNTQWGVSGFPTLYLIGRDGRVIGRAGGGGPSENPAVTRLLAKGGIPVPTAHLPPEDADRPKSVPMVGKTPAMSAGARTPSDIVPPLALRPAPAAADAAAMRPAAPATPTMRFANMAAGEVVPDFSALAADGREMKLSDFKGRTVFISFWTGARNPPADVAQLHAAYATQGLAVWAINTATERADFDAWAREHASALGHPVSWDPAGKAVMEASSYMIFGAGMYPAYCVVGPDGKLVGGMIGMGARVSGWLREMLGRAGIALTETDKELVAQAVAASRPPAATVPAAAANAAEAPSAAPARAAAPMGGMGGMAPAQRAPSTGRQGMLPAGAVAPDFVMQTADGRELKLSDFKGKVVILDFWATWCGPCIASFPHTQDLAKKYKDQDVVVLASGTSDTIAKFKEWIPRNAPKYPDMVWAFDPNERGSATFEERASNKLYGVTGIPTQFIIGRDGRVVASVIGNGGKDDARTEVALAEAGVKVDEAVLAKGREQLAKSAEQARARAAAEAEAERNPPPPFRENFGRVQAGQPWPDLDILRLDGTTAKFSTLAPGRVTVLGVWSGGNGPGDPYLADWRRWSAAYPQVAFVGLGGFASVSETADWAAKQEGPLGFTLVADPAGRPAAPRAPLDELSDDERAEFRRAQGEHYQRVFTVQAAGVMPPVPTTIVLDAAGKLVGWSAGYGPRYGETLANLFLRAGVTLAPADRPARVYAKEETKDAPPEPRREMLKIGAMAPDFTTQDLVGRDVKLSDYRGKVVVLDFWATWCGPCMAAMPHTQEVAAQYKDQDVVVLGSCTSDARDKFEDWVRRNQEKYPDIVWTHDKAGRAPERASAALYGVSGIPTQFIINREGKVVDIVIGYQKGEVILDASLAKAGVKVAPEILAKAEQDLKRRGR